ncbi:F-box only protein 30-like [Schistocerca piceifrons]|uniref:F-box only protein 30-like n=1 Tax=Schistocerca piceifrons TaxID=274613 RepID=UPI001F5F7D08|nr:F-box only protein 30-like [Schistocerca piceifrons]
MHPECKKLGLPLDEDHSHCQNCIKVKECKAKGLRTEKCGIIDCPNDCGFMFHKCKTSEHLLLCLNLRVPCINSGNGCPFTMPRKERGKHLETCPASVVVCTVEWNRWPTCKIKGPHLPRQSHKSGQLDADLAQSDERALVKSFENPMWKRQYRHCCNNFFPAIPVSKEKDGIELIFNDTQDGLSSQESSPAVPVSKQIDCNEGTFVEALDGSSSPEKSIGQLNTSSSDDVTEFESDQEQCSSSTNKRVYNFVSNETPVSSTSLSNNIEAEAVEQHSNANENGIDTFSEISSVVLPLSFSLSLTIDRLPRSQSKPMDIYTFLCAQEFRRDDYGWHYKNVHCDIQGGLDGWVEYRCPLAQYGCTYSIKRLHPCKLGASVIHSEELESFGFKETANSIEESHSDSDQQQLHLAELPFELLSQICLYLDSFSLCNLSKTCRRLRSVCFSRLKERGIILQQWNKILVNGRVSWVTSKVKWVFSTAFSPIEGWVHTNSGNMSDHLHHCAYNVRHSYDEQYYRVIPHELTRRIELKCSTQNVTLTHIENVW